jgi:deazaflavin-dependent oxidoreductase (nitroreductase family)
MGLPTDKPKGLDTPLTKTIIKAASRAHVKVFKLTNGRIGSTWRVGAAFKKPAPTLLLEHSGRKSGKVFTTPLLYLENGPDLVVVASQGGRAEHPQWFRNLMANPDTQVHLRGERGRSVRARRASSEEKAQLWPRLVDMYADYANYQRWTDREIPVVILEPR